MTTKTAITNGTLLKTRYGKIIEVMEVRGNVVYAYNGNYYHITKLFFLDGSKVG